MALAVVVDSCKKRLSQVIDTDKKSSEVIDIDSNRLSNVINLDEKRLSKVIEECSNRSSTVIYQDPIKSIVIYDVPFKIRVTNITVPGYGPTNVPPIGIAIIGINNYIL